MAKMVPYSDFTAEILLGMDDIPEELAENYVRLAAIDFCEKSQVLIRRLHIDVQACVEDYPLETFDCERIVSIQKVCTSNGCCASPGNVLTHEPCQLAGCNVHGTSVWLVPPDTLQLRPAPTVDRDNALWVEVAVAPKRDSCEVDALLYEKYYEAIIDGALARLYAVPSSKRHDKALAATHREAAKAGITAAGIDRLTGGARGPFKIRSRRIV